MNKMTFRKFIDIIMLALCLSWVMAIPAGAAQTTWTNIGGTGLFSNPLNWSGAAKPGAADTITLDATSVANLTIDSNAVWASFNKTAAYTGNIYFGATVDTTRGNMSLLGNASDTAFLQTARLPFLGDWKCGINVSSGTSTLVANGTGLQVWKCNGLYYDLEKPGSGTLRDSSNMNFAGDMTMTDGVKNNNGFKDACGGDMNLNLDTVNATVAGSTDSLYGTNGALHIGSTTAVNAAQLAVVMNTATAGVIDCDISTTVKQLTIGANAIVASAGSATTTYNNATGPAMVFIDNGSFTHSNIVVLQTGVTGQIISIIAGTPTFTQNSTLTIRHGASNKKITFPALVITGIGTSHNWTGGAGNYSGDTFSLGGNITIPKNLTAGNVGGSVAGTKSVFETNNYHLTVGGSLIVGNSATNINPIEYNFGSSNVSIGNLNNSNIYQTQLYNFGSSKWTVSGNVSIGNDTGGTFNAGTSVWTIDSIATITSSTKKFASRINIRPLAAQTVAFADAMKCDSLYADSGTVTFAGAGNDTVGYMRVTGTANFTRDTTVFTGDMTLAAGSTITIDAASKWVCTKDGVVLVLNDKSIPLVQLIGSANINGGATIAQLLPVSDDSVRIQAATRVNITSIPATTWDGTAGHLKYFLTPTINQGCTLTTPAYTASYGYYGGIHRDSIDAAFSRGCKSRGDN